MFLGASAQPDVTTWLSHYAVQFGIFGLAFFDVFVTRKIFIPKWAKDEAVAAKMEIIAVREQTIVEKNSDIAELKASLAQLQTVTREQVLPALVRANQLSADYVQEITRRAYPDPYTTPQASGRSSGADSH